MSFMPLSVSPWLILILPMLVVGALTSAALGTP